MSEICYSAEKDMPSEVMTEILVACVESVIKVSDLLRALSGPRTREAGVTMTLEAAARSMPHDARDPT
ncbi:MAG: hypothetical protein ACU0E9_09990 [Limimaricola soesokkakensis]|uniref:hypothetical protein n=1 Tax=Limimaricola soesokkakensis TaxID=1343159 RepID=UPI00405A10EB